MKEFQGEKLAVLSEHIGMYINLPAFANQLAAMLDLETDLMTAIASALNAGMQKATEQLENKDTPFQILTAIEIVDSPFKEGT